MSDLDQYATFHLDREIYFVSQPLSLFD